MKRKFLSWGILFVILMMTVTLLGVRFLGEAAASGYATSTLESQMRSVHRDLEIKDGRVTWIDDGRSLEKGFSFVLFDVEGEQVFSYSDDSQALKKAIYGIRERLLSDEHNKPRPITQKQMIDNKTYMLGGRHVFLHPSEGRYVKVIIIGYLCEDEMDNIYSSVSRYMIAASFAVGVLMLVLLYVEWNRISKIIEGIGAQAEKIGEKKDFSSRLTSNKKYPELEALIDAHNRLLDRFEDMLDSQRSFVRNVSHELRTPLAVVDAQCQAIISDGELDDNIADRIDRIERQNKHMKDLVSQLLLLSRLEQGGDDPFAEDIRLDEMVEFVCSDLEESLGGEKLFDLRLEEIAVRANMSYLVILVRNLMANAIKYGRTKKEIEVRLYREKPYICFEVRDYGKGLSDEVSGKMYEPFFRGDRSRSEEGYGLGLTLAARIADYYRGRLIGENISGGGCRFMAEISDDLLLF